MLATIPFVLAKTIENVEPVVSLGNIRVATLQNVIVLVNKYAVRIVSGGMRVANGWTLGSLVRIGTDSLPD